VGCLVDASLDAAQASASLGISHGTPDGFPEVPVVDGHGLAYPFPVEDGDESRALAVQQLSGCHAAAGASGALLHVVEQLPKLPGWAVRSEPGVIVARCDRPDVEVARNRA
jgi:hypothetical protein